MEALQLEKVFSCSSGCEITHSRAKQRSDARETKFLVPRSHSGPNYAGILEEYLSAVRNVIGKVTGRMWFCGRNDIFIQSPMGKNYLSNVPHEMAMRLSLENPANYTFHSYRRSAATMAANEGASGLQMQQNFGWKNIHMAQEYISTSKVAIKDVASKLAGFGDQKEKKKVESVAETNGEDNNVIDSMTKGLDEVKVAPQVTEKKNDGISPVVNKNLKVKETVVEVEDEKKVINLEGIEAQKVFIIHGGSHHFSIN